MAPRDFNSYGVAPRQPRGDDARHVRQHPPAQPARPRHRGRRHAPSCPTASSQSIYDAAMRYADGGRAAGRARRQGVRLGLLARLGRQGHAPARRARRDRAELSSASTARTSSAWACCRCSSPTARAHESLGLSGEEVFAIDGIAGGTRGDRKRGEGAGRRCAVNGRAATESKRSRSSRACGSTRRARATTTVTAASCSTFCDSCWPHDRRRRDRGDRPPPRLLLDLLRAMGPRDMRRDPAAVWRQAADAFAEVSADVLGTPLARVSARHGAPARRDACS